MKADSPYINRFLQPDSLIPGVDNPQSWNRFSYTSNSPLNLVDSSGHDGTPPAGNQIQVNIALGLNIGPLLLAYASLNLVTDSKGGLQLYFTKRDQDFHEGSTGTMGGFESGSAESAHSTQLFAFGGASVTWGAIDGSDFRNRGTLAFAGKSVNAVLSVGPVATDAYASADPVTGELNTNVAGYDVGYSFGGPLTYGTVSTSSIPLTDRWQMPGWALPICRLVGQCGSAVPPPIDNPMIKQPLPPKNPPKFRTPLITPLQEYPKPPKLMD